MPGAEITPYAPLDFAQDRYQMACSGEIGAGEALEVSRLAGADDVPRVTGALQLAVAALDEPPVGVRLDQTDALPSAGDADSERIENLTVCQREVCSPSRDGDQALLGKIGLFAVGGDSEVLRDPHLDRMACGHHFYDNWYT